MEFAESNQTFRKPNCSERIRLNMNFGRNENGHFVYYASFSPNTISLILNKYHVRFNINRNVTSYATSD